MKCDKGKCQRSGKAVDRDGQPVFRTDQLVKGAPSARREAELFAAIAIDGIVLSKGL